MLSSASPVAGQRVALVGLAAPLLQLEEVKLLCPNARVAVTFVGGLAPSSYSSTRLELVSETYRFAELSSAALIGKQSELTDTPPLLHVLLVKLLPCPQTSSALESPLPATIVVVRGGLYSNTRLLPKSTT